MSTALRASPVPVKQQQRCPVCGRLLFMRAGEVEWVEIKCKCGRFVTVRGDQTAVRSAQ